MWKKSGVCKQQQGKGGKALTYAAAVRVFVGVITRLSVRALVVQDETVHAGGNEGTGRWLACSGHHGKLSLRTLNFQGSELRSFTNKVENIYLPVFQKHPTVSKLVMLAH